MSVPYQSFSFPVIEAPKGSSVPHPEKHDPYRMMEYDAEIDEKKTVGARIVYELKEGAGCNYSMKIHLWGLSYSARKALKEASAYLDSWAIDDVSFDKNDTIQTFRQVEMNLKHVALDIGANDFPDRKILYLGLLVEGDNFQSRLVPDSGPIRLANIPVTHIRLKPDNLDSSLHNATITEEKLEVTSTTSDLEDDTNQQLDSVLLNQPSVEHYLKNGNSVAYVEDTQISPILSLFRPPQSAIKTLPDTMMSFTHKDSRPLLIAHLKAIKSCEAIQGPNGLKWRLCNWSSRCADFVLQFMNKDQQSKWKPLVSDDNLHKAVSSNKEFSLQKGLREKYKNYDSLPLLVKNKLLHLIKSKCVENVLEVQHSFDMEDMGNKKLVGVNLVVQRPQNCTLCMKCLKGDITQRLYSSQVDNPHKKHQSFETIQSTSGSHSPAHVFARSVQWIASQSEEDWTRITLQRNPIITSTNAKMNPSVFTHSDHILGHFPGHEDYIQIRRLWNEVISCDPRWMFVLKNRKSFYKEYNAARK